MKIWYSNIKFWVNKESAMSKGKCPACEKENAEIIEGSHNFLDGDEVRAIQKEHPSWNKATDICEECIDHYKMHH